MAENREFIAAKNLPVTEAEEVDILCVEDGELKRRPAKGFGGNQLYILKLTQDMIDKESEIDFGLPIIANCEEMVEAIESGMQIMIEVTNEIFEEPEYFRAMAIPLSFGEIYNPKLSRNIFCIYTQDIPFLLLNTRFPNFFKE